MRVTVRIFGQTLHGTEVGRRADSDGQVWVRVQLDEPTIIGGVGPAAEYVHVAPRAVEVEQ